MFNSKNRNLPLPESIDILPIACWDEQLAAEKLKELFKYTVYYADTGIAWYLRYRKRKGRIARFIRMTSILLLISSTLMPYFAAIDKDQTNATLLYIGYLFAGLGGGLLLLDRYYGYSNTWIRFVLTGKDLELIRDAFVEHWQIVYVQNLPLTKDGFCKLVAEITTFRELFAGTVKAETQAWAREYQESMKELITALKVQSDQMKDAYVQSVQDQNNKAGVPSKDTSVNNLEIPEDIFQQAIKENYKDWKEQYGVVAVSYGLKIRKWETQAVKSLIFLPPQKLETGVVNFKPIPPSILYKAPNGLIYELPTDVVGAGGNFKAANKPALLCDFILPKRPGVSISRINDDKKDSTGTLGLIVFKDNQPHLLSCYHVLCAQELERGDMKFDPSHPIGAATIISPSREDETKDNEFTPLGPVIDGELDPFLDGAIASIDPTVDVRQNICSINRIPKAPLSITQAHADNHHPVMAVGRTSGTLRGTIVTHDTACDIEYDIKGKVVIFSLEHIILADLGAAAGDSGSAVIDYDNNVVGILIATNGHLSCIVPIGRLLTRFKITLNPTT